MELEIDFPLPVHGRDLKPGELFVVDHGREQFVGLRLGGDGVFAMLLSRDPEDANFPEYADISHWEGLRRISGKLRLSPGNGSLGRDSFGHTPIGSIRITLDGDIQIMGRLQQSARPIWASLKTGEVAQGHIADAVTHRNWSLRLVRGEGQHLEEIILAHRSVIDID